MGGMTRMRTNISRMFWWRKSPKVDSFGLDSWGNYRRSLPLPLSLSRHPRSPLDPYSALISDPFFAFNNFSSSRLSRLSRGGESQQIKAANTLRKRTHTEGEGVFDSLHQCCFTLHHRFFFLSLPLSLPLVLSLGKKTSQKSSGQKRRRKKRENCYEAGWKNIFLCLHCLFSSPFPGITRSRDRSRGEQKASPTSPFSAMEKPIEGDMNDNTWCDELLKDYER